MTEKDNMYEFKEITAKKLICERCKEKYNKEINVIVYPYNQEGYQIMFCLNETDPHFQILSKEEVEDLRKTLNS